MTDTAKKGSDTLSIDFGNDIYEEPIVAKTFLQEDAQEGSLRPKTLREYIGQDQVGPEVQGLPDPLPRLEQAGIGVDAAEGPAGQAGPLQRGEHPVQQAAAAGALAPVDHQHPPGAQLGGLGAGLSLGARAEGNGGGLIKFKCVHEDDLLQNGARGPRDLLRKLYHNRGREARERAAFFIPAPPPAAGIEWGAARPGPPACRHHTQSCRRSVL